MARLKIFSIVGTRPEAVKLVPVLRALKRQGDLFDSIVCATAQHRELLDQVLAEFDVSVDHDLDLMRKNQAPADLVGPIVDGLVPILSREMPDWVLVQGDTTTTMAAALAAEYSGCSVAHIEAGLRSKDKRNPFPEEINRRVTDVLSDLHFAPTMAARTNLLFEGVEEDRIVVTGNTVIDALYQALSIPLRKGSTAERVMRESGCLILVTAHRRESFGEPLERICRALLDIAGSHPEVRIVYPVHPNPNVRHVVREMLGRTKNILLLEPMGYVEWVHLMNHSRLILTDSGGIQEEAPALGRPVLVMREVTERPEALRAGAARIVGTDPERIVAETELLLRDEEAYRSMAKRRNIYGDGSAAYRILSALAGERLPDWLPEETKELESKSV